MRIAPVVLATFLLSSPVWAACNGTEVIGGDFETGEKGWGEADEQFRVAGGEATLTPRSASQTARWNAGKPVTNAEVCATISMPDTTEDASRGYAGLLFWVIDKDNFHQAVISRNGMISVARKVGGQILAASPVNWMPAKALNLGPGAKNVLQLALDGQSVVLHINGSEVARFRGQAPEAASRVGFVASSAPMAIDTWRISDFKVTEPVAAPVAENSAARASEASSATTGAIDIPADNANCGVGPVLFEDKFVDQDTMWGKSARVTLGGGGAAFEPAPGTSALQWNRAFVFDDLDVCATVQLANVTTNPTASYAGLLFWVEDSRNYYQAVVAPNGYFTVARIVDGKAVAKRPIEWTKSAAVKTGAKERNALRLSVKGGEVQVFINGQQAGSFRAEPPRRATYIGMLAASADSKKGDTWTVSDLKVTAPQ